jgi:tRNA dimethylallyltransferase
MRPKIAVVTGPTATGKTALGVLLAETMNGEVVSADSMQIYKGMDIGTAKPAPEETRGVPHHMIDVADPAENYSVARYVEEASVCVDGIISRGKLPILVGGTGLYIDSLIAGRNFAGAPGDDSLREELNRRYDELGGRAMLEELAKVDPERAARLHPADRKRIVRALEVWRLTGKTITEHDEETKKIPPRYDAACIALSFKNRQHLYDRINRRVDQMVEQGLFREVDGLLKSGLSEKCTAMQAIGYKEAVAALQGRISFEEAVETIKRETRRYAKRQLTWLKRKPDVFWLLWDGDPDYEAGLRISTEFLRSLGIK